MPPVKKKVSRILPPHRHVLIACPCGPDRCLMLEICHEENNDPASSTHAHQDHIFSAEIKGFHVRLLSSQCCSQHSRQCVAGSRTAISVQSQGESPILPHYGKRLPLVPGNICTELEQVIMTESPFKGCHAMFMRPAESFPFLKRPAEL